MAVGVEQIVPYSRGSTEVVKTGSWSSRKPFYLDKVSPCREACPAGNDIAGMLALLSQGDFDGGLSLHDTSWMQFYCEDGQETLDTIIQAYRISEYVLIPAMVIIDGFFHELKSAFTKGTCTQGRNPYQAFWNRVNKLEEENELPQEQVSCARIDPPEHAPDIRGSSSN